jgi:ribosomal protein RSM22 (predicted rRNA methylase)
VLTAPLPAALDDALAHRRASSEGSTSRAGADLTRRYRERGRPSGPVARSRDEVGAYAAARLPATYAAVRIALGELAARAPAFAPRTLLDLGAGPGTAAWAAAGLWPSLRAVTAVEAEPEMRRLGEELARAADSAAVAGAEWVAGALPRAIPPAPFDLVTVSYVLGELAESDRTATVERGWEAAAGALVVVEPGTPDGYERVIEVRDRLIALGGTVVAPCPHDRTCPLAGSADWCHFAVRVARTRAHRAAKDARLGHEDEKFSYVVVARAPGAPAAARILRHPQVRGGHVLLRLCAIDGVRPETVSRRDGDRYRRARKLSWGDDLGP